MRFERFDDVCAQALEAVKNDPSFREGHKAIQASFLSQLGGWYMANHGADLDAKVGTLEPLAQRVYACIMEAAAHLEAYNTER